MDGLAITGTGTGVGKTVVAAALLLGLQQRDPASSYRYWKPLQTGCPPDDDTQEVLRLTGLERESVLSPYLRLRRPASPWEAARAEGRNPTDLWRALRRRPPPSEAFVIVEGAGGLLVPISRRRTFADLFSVWHLPLVLVTSPEVGTINHTLLSLEAISRRDLSLAAVVFSGAPSPDVRSLIADRAPVIVFPRLPFARFQAPPAAGAQRARPRPAGPTSRDSIREALAGFARMVSKSTASPHRPPAAQRPAPGTRQG